jgi:hypothetical protein
MAGTNMNMYYGYKGLVYSLLGTVPFEEDSLSILATGGSSYFCGFLLPPTCIALRKADFDKETILIPNDKIIRTMHLYFGADKSYTIEHEGERYSCNMYLPLQEFGWR